jgi:hypothetical protein
MANRTFFIFFSVLLIVLVVELLRRSVLREKYAAYWALTALTFFLFAIDPSAPLKISKALGFETPSNFILGLFIGLLLVIAMQLSLEVGKLEDKIQTLAEESAISREREQREQKK